jgi:hypothetical protein
LNLAYDLVYSKFSVKFNLYHRYASEAAKKLNDAADGAAAAAAEARAAAATDTTSAAGRRAKLANKLVGLAHFSLHYTLVLELVSSCALT